MNMELLVLVQPDIIRLVKAWPKADSLMTP
jgi:hypothetical protein